jgi:hypothetical protein
MPPVLTKSNYMAGLQCPRLLWTQVHKPEEMPPTDLSTQYIFDQGHTVGELAKKLHPAGVDIPYESFMGNIERTRELLKWRQSLFEAGIMSGRLYARPDILVPVGVDEWDLIDVKSSAFVRHEHIADLSFQRHCCVQAGLKIRQTGVIHINNKYVKNGAIRPDELLFREDISEKVEATSAGTVDRITAVLAVMDAALCPDAEIGARCSEPHKCPLDCRAALPKHNVFTLCYPGKKAPELYANGIVEIKDIPDDYRLNAKQEIQRLCVICGRPHIDKAAIGQFLATLKYPLYYLDFETVGPAVPLFDGTRPFQNTPFQFSLHVVTAEDAPPRHFSYLARRPDDFRLDFLNELRQVLGTEGSIVAYNRKFEEGILRELGQLFPEHADWIDKARARMVDLLEPFAQWHYYDPGQKGHASLKDVLPALTGRGYEALEISDGKVASIRFEKAVFGDTPQDERDHVMVALEEYCGLDTDGMISIVGKLLETQEA